MRKYIARILRWQAKIFINKNQPKIVVITGSVGKTSTTQAIATILKQSFKVRATLKNYNSDVGVPCSVFQKKLPESLRNPFAWVWLFLQNFAEVLHKTDVDVLVLELGTDKPGEIAEFAWLKPDIAVVTAVAPEHMEFFSTLEKVAQEELSVSRYSEKTLISHEMVASEFLQFAETENLFNYSREDLSRLGLEAENLQVVGEHGLDAISAGIAVGRALGMDSDALKAGASQVKPQPGRMNLLKGIKNSTLIDDTYNSSPEAVEAALKYLYSTDAPYKVALLGNMNELGVVSEQAHSDVGKLCNPKKLDLLITLGPDANKYTAKKAELQGCKVERVDTPYKAAQIIGDNLKENSLVLLKGSQNGVFAEEAVKLLLADSSDEEKLVRQDKFWLKKKQDSFSDD